MPPYVGGSWSGMTIMKTENKEQFYWRGVHFPGSMNNDEFKKWELVKKDFEIETENLTTNQAKFWNNVYLTSVFVLCIIAILL